MSLLHVLNSVSYLPGASNVGLAVGNHGEAILIDSGVGQRSGRQLLQLLEGQNLRLVAILNTHGHGDHVGGNAYLVQHTGAKVYAPLHDGIVLKHPIWGTMCTFAGAEPIQELSSPRFAPEPCDTDVTVTQGEIQVAGLAVQVVPLPGHTGSHTGYIVDDVFFTGDILAGEAELAHASISYAYSITQRLASLQKLRQSPCARYVLGHGPVEKDISSLIDHNIASITEVLNFVRGRLAGDAVEANELLRAVCDHFDIHIRNVREYYMLYPTLHAFLSHLDNTGEVAPAIQDNRLVWHTLDRR